MNQARIPSVPSLQQRNLTARWLALAGVVGPILFLSVLTILGFLRPGYSQIRQAGSDLGVGPNAWIFNLSLVITGLLLIAFAIGFFLGMDQILKKGWRLTCLVLLILSGVGFIWAGIFTEAPATVTLHWTIGFPLALLSPLVVCFIVGRQWRRVSEWRGYGRYPERIARLVITPCECFENVPPGLPGRTAELGVKMPCGAFLMAQALRWHVLRRLPLTFGWMAKRPIPHELIDAWLRPLQTKPGVRRDLARFVHAFDKGDMRAAADGLRRFDRPALVVWAPEDRINPREYGRRWADLLPRGHLIEIADSYTLVPLDQPTELARVLRQFVQDTSS